MPDRLRSAALGLSLLAAALLAVAGPVAATPEIAAEHIAAARAAAQRGDGIAAEAELRKAMTAGARRPMVAARMGEAYLLQGDLRRAREWLAAGDFDAADAALGWRMQGQLLRWEGRLGEAGEALDRALALAPDDPLLWVEIARLRFAGGEHLLAIEAADRAVAAGPEEPRALELQALLLRDRAGPVATMPLFEKALETTPDDRALLLGLAASQGDAGFAAAMLATTRRVQEIAPGEALPFFYQAAIAARAGETGLARGLLSRAAGRLDDLPAAMLLQGALDLESGNAASAVEVLERLDRRQPASPLVQQLYAHALYAARDYRRLHERFDPLAARADAPAYLLLLLGRAHEDAGNGAAAAPLLDRAAAASAAPLSRYAPVDTAPPGSFAAHAGAGDAALADGQFGTAYAHYLQAARIRYPEWLMQRAVVALDRDGRGDLAAAAAAQYAAAFPASLSAPRLLAMSAAFESDWPRARLLLENLNRRSGQRDVRLLADLSLAQLRAGDLEAALNTAETAHRLNRASPVAAQARGMALAALGRDSDVAAALLAKAQRINGDNPLLREARGRLARR